MKIRKANEGDVKRIHTIYKKGIVDELGTQNLTKEILKYKWPEGEIRKKLSLKKEFLLVAEENQVLGFAHAKILDSKRGLIDKIYVDIKFRNKGVAKKLVSEILRWFKLKKIKDVRANILIKNYSSIKLIQKFNFKPRYTNWELRLK